ncbi:hypothetical protein [Streptomyces sp. NPDC015130]|uniref:hypothetical protein n=1 Tax=Streptomyces sp. NPDC015130 TaxID=3364940 RepID=UPI0036F90906
MQLGGAPPGPDGDDLERSPVLDRGAPDTGEAPHPVEPLLVDPVGLDLQHVPAAHTGLEAPGRAEGTDPATGDHGDPATELVGLGPM